MLNGTVSRDRFIEMRTRLIAAMRHSRMAEPLSLGGCSAPKWLKPGEGNHIVTQALTETLLKLDRQLYATGNQIFFPC
jgi:hypothetical protein